jgi:predicted nucleic acid-binding protein
MMRVVLDASYLIEFLENFETGKFRWILDCELVAPCLLRYEYNNVLMRKTKNNTEIIDKFRDAIYDLSIGYVDLAGMEEDTTSLAIRHGLLFYDASYLVVAKDKSLPIATYDAELMKAATAEGIKVIP